MNKLKTTYPAGVDFNWDDLAWMQDATREAFYALLSAFGIDPDESFILSGCAVTIGPSSASTTAGYISLNGEILKVSAHSISYDGSSPVVWRLQETDDPTGSETDSASNTVECYQKRVAVLYQAASYTNEMAYNADNLTDVISKQLNLNTDWTSVPYNSAYFGGSSLVMNGTSTKIYYKVIGKTMFISLYLSITSMNPGGLTFYLQSATGYKIIRDMYTIGGCTMSANNVAIQVRSQMDPLNILYLSNLGGANFPALTTAGLYCEMTLEVEPV